MLNYFNIQDKHSRPEAQSLVDITNGGAACGAVWSPWLFFLTSLRGRNSSCMCLFRVVFNWLPLPQLLIFVRSRLVEQHFWLGALDSRSVGERNHHVIGVLCWEYQSTPHTVWSKLFNAWFCFYRQKTLNKSLKIYLVAKSLMCFGTSPQFGELQSNSLMKRLINATIKIMDAPQHPQYPGSFPKRNN